MKELLRKSLVGISYLSMVVINALANTLPINGRTTGGISDSYPNLFAPAGITFSIWGLIYLLLAGYVLFHTGIFQKAKSVAAKQVASLFIISSLANVAWIFSWHYGIIWLSVIFMLTILISLISIATKLSSLKLSVSERWFVRLPFSAYFGWITIATIANITTFLVSVGWNGFGLSEAVWTIIILFIGAIIGLWRAFIDQDIAYIAVFIWAYIGILIKHLSPQGFSGQYDAVVTTIIICLALFTVMIAYLTYLSVATTKSNSSKKSKLKHK